MILLKSTIISLNLGYILQFFWTITLLNSFSSLDANNLQFLDWTGIFNLVHWEYWKDLVIRFSSFSLKFTFMHANVLNNGKNVPLDFEEIASDKQQIYVVT